MITKFTIKPLILSVLFMVCIAGYAGNTLAAQNPAHNFIENLSENALKVIKSKSSANQKEKKLVSLFIKSVDTKWIARFAMGKYWREATPTQRSDYLKIHKKFLLNSYIPKFKEYTNQRIKIKKSYANSKSDNEYVVETQIVSTEGVAINIDYKVRKSKDGKYKIFDVVAEGVSLIITQRSDFASILVRGGIKDLIRRLDKKT